MPCWPSTASPPSTRAHHKPDRERVRHGPPPDGPRQGRALPGYCQAHGLQAHHRSIQNLAQTEGRKPVAQSHPGCQIPRRHRGQRADITHRRLTTSSPKFRYSSHFARNHHIIESARHVQYKALLENFHLVEAFSEFLNSSAVSPDSIGNGIDLWTFDDISSGKLL